MLLRAAGRILLLLPLPLVSAVTSMACAGHASCPSGAPTVALPVSPSTSASARPEHGDAHASIPSNEKKTSPCFARGRPKPAAASFAPKNKKDGSSPFCAGFNEVELGRIEQRIRRDFVKYEKPSLLVVDWGCDEAYGASRELVYEDGSGHGGSLRIMRFQWRADGVVTFRRLASSHYHGRGVAVDTTETTAAKLDPILAKSRIALLARLHLVRLETKTGGLGLSGSFSSNDFHLLLRITDDAERVTEGQFTGYDSSSEQEKLMPLRLAAEPIDKLLAGLQLARASGPTDDDRAFFTARLLTTLAGNPYWWVKERYVEDAAAFGTPDALPALVAIAQEGGNASADRAREHALDSIAAITGWNPRVDVEGKSRSVEQAARAVLEACAP